MSGAIPLFGEVWVRGAVEFADYRPRRTYLLAASDLHGSDFLRVMNAGCNEDIAVEPAKF